MTKRLYSNGGPSDFVVGPLQKYIHNSTTVCAAAPYFTRVDELRLAANGERTVQLLIGLNTVTSPAALGQALALPNTNVRFLTRDFHAKIYLFDNAGMVGSSNLTGGGLMANREAMLCVEAENEPDVLDELRALFADLWQYGQSLDEPQLERFKAVHAQFQQKTGLTPDEIIEEAVGKVRPRNFDVKSASKTKVQLFIDGLRKDVVEQYRPYFTRIGQVLEGSGYLRPEFERVGLANQTNRFLNWVRLAHAPGDNWKTAEILPPSARDDKIIQLGPQWVETADHMVPDEYFPWLGTVQDVFGTSEALRAADRQSITKGLLCLHAFNEQLRFVAGGLKNLPLEFWSQNNNDVERVRATLMHLLHDKGDFVERLHDVLYDRQYKLQLFGKFCALELLGTVKPEVSPPMTGRMAKAMRYLGFDVKAN
ncbi:phospholipase D-like domain-containing protein [Asticcacaulis solisilvae]|uniref:phospholipase D-like domain-containing protein n=1 Tax=Asticcacaulis solisilvae TaxID=1217274 RepID=UPI003FD85827